MSRDDLAPPRATPHERRAARVRVDGSGDADLVAALLRLGLPGVDLCARRVGYGWTMALTLPVLDQAAWILLKEIRDRPGVRDVRVLEDPGWGGPPPPPLPLAGAEPNDADTAGSSSPAAQGPGSRGPGSRMMDWLLVLAILLLVLVLLG